MHYVAQDIKSSEISYHRRILRGIMGTRSLIFFILLGLRGFDGVGSFYVCKKKSIIFINNVDHLKILPKLNIYVKVDYFYMSFLFLFLITSSSYIKDSITSNSFTPKNKFKTTPITYIYNPKKTQK